MAKILICDDEPEIRDILKHQLEHNGHECTTVEQGLEGFKKNLTKNFDLIITDVMMPNWTGFDLANTLEMLNDATKIIILTGYAKNEFMEKFQHMKNVVEIITKPWDRQQLLKTIESHL